MQLAKVIGSMVSTRKCERLEGMKLLVAVPIDMETMEEKGAPFVTADTVGAGEGEIVMWAGGSSSRQTDLTKKYIKRGFENQMQNKGFSLIEVLSPCPTNWHLDPVDAVEKIKNESVKVFPLGVYANRGGEL